MERYNGRPVVPGTQVTLLSNPKKMPGYTFGLPAVGSCPWAVFHKSDAGQDAICGHCYAGKGSYVWPVVKAAYATRYQWVRECMKTEDGRQEFVTTMVEAIGRTRETYFRIHDSGDFFNAAYVDCWREIVAQLPAVRFWAPTRGWQSKNPWRLNLQALAAEPNMTMRPSALFVGVNAPAIDGFAAGSTAAVDGWNCPAHLQQNQCGSCRRCWDAPELAITYRLH